MDRMTATPAGVDSEDPVAPPVLDEDKAEPAHEEGAKKGDASDTKAIETPLEDNDFNAQPGF